MLVCLVLAHVTFCLHNKCVAVYYIYEENQGIIAREESSIIFNNKVQN